MFWTIHEPSFKQTAGEAVFSEARVIVTLGSRAVHSHRSIPADAADALTTVP
jgi:type I restriction enzyme R subunit